jgi:hypothetical protein
MNPRRGMAVVGGGTITFVAMNSVMVLEMNGELASVKRDELKIDWEHPSTLGWMLASLLECGQQVSFKKDKVWIDGGLAPGGTVGEALRRAL